MTFDPLTTGIIAAVGAGLAKVGETAVVDAYNGVKSLIVKKFGKESQLKKAVDALEERPDSESRKGMVKEEVEAAKAHEDADLLAAANLLLAALKKLKNSSGATGAKIGDTIIEGSLTAEQVVAEGPNSTGLEVTSSTIKQDVRLGKLGAKTSPN